LKFGSLTLPSGLASKREALTLGLCRAARRQIRNKANKPLGARRLYALTANTHTHPCCKSHWDSEWGEDGIRAEGIPRGCEGSNPPPHVAMLRYPPHLAILTTLFSHLEISFPGPKKERERVRAETGGADQWVLNPRKFLGVAGLKITNFCILGIPTISCQ